MALFRRKPTVSDKVNFTINPMGIRWDVYIEKQKTQHSPPIVSIPQPDISVIYSPENEYTLSCVEICWADKKVTMEAPQFSYETKVLGQICEGFNQDGSKVVTYEEDSHVLHVCLSGMTVPFEGERFSIMCSGDCIAFYSENQTIMELRPVFSTRNLGNLQINCWISQSHLEYLPYLCGLFGYVKLA